MENSSIYIRQVTIDDAKNILDWENNEENWGVSENDSPYTLYDIIVLIGELQNVVNAKQGRWMICLKENNQAIGCVDITGIDFETGVGDVGILIADKSFRKKGYASISLEQIEKEAFNLGLDKLTCSIHSSNIASINLFLKSGYMEIEKEKIGIRFFEKWLKK